MSNFELDLSFNQFKFVSYYKSISGNLRNTNFYTALVNSGEAVINDIFGVEDSTEQEAYINPDLFYNNWQTSDQANLYVSLIFSNFFSNSSGRDLRGNWALLQDLSGFLIQYYFFFKRNQNSILPQIVDINKSGYFIQTTNLYIFFKSNLVRGIGNFTINSMCQFNLDSISGDDNKRTYISKSPSLLGWCGCFAPLDPIIEVSGVNVPVECDPLCISQPAIKRWEGNGNSLISCQTAVCVMSGISLNVQESSERSYNFNQICDGCAKNSTDDQPCRCVIDSDFASLLTKIAATGGDGNPSGMDVSGTFNRYCPNAICIITDYTQEGTRVVECNTLNPSATGLGVENYATGEVTYTFDVEVSSGTIGLIVLFVLLPLILLSFIAIVKSSQTITISQKK